VYARVCSLLLGCEGRTSARYRAGVKLPRCISCIQMRAVGLCTLACAPSQVVEGCDAALQLDADKADILSLVQVCAMLAPQRRPFQNPPSASSLTELDIQDSARPGSCSLRSGAWIAGRSTPL